MKSFVTLFHCLCSQIHFSRIEIYLDMPSRLCATQVFLTSDGKGWGLRTLEDLPKGTFVCEFVGEILTLNELHERNMKNPKGGKYTFPVLLDADWDLGVVKDREALCLYAASYGNVARFINHRYLCFSYFTGVFCSYV